MDFCRNVSVPSDYQQEPALTPPCSKLASIDDLFPAHNTEVDVSLEWLSIFVEDCLSSTGNCIAPTQSTHTTKSPNLETQTQTPKPPKPQQQTPPSLEKFIIPSKARSKRKRVSSTTTTTTERTSWISTTHNNNNQQHQQDQFFDPPLLHHETYWLADSELILPKKEDHQTNTNNGTDTSNKVKDIEKSVVEEEEEGINGNSIGQQQPRRCTHCLAQRTPQWRAGPLGPKTLCNACGVRYKSGRLLPEYRPAKSPTFVSYLHSNSHKKVMEMRMALIPSVPK